jgi:hypothetical protein
VEHMTLKYRTVLMPWSDSCKRGGSVVSVAIDWATSRFLNYCGREYCIEDAAGPVDFQWIARRGYLRTDDTLGADVQVCFAINPQFKRQFGSARPAACERVTPCPTLRSLQEPKSVLVSDWHAKQTECPTVGQARPAHGCGA